ncbi:MAG: amidohydrolase [Phenylobacterium sp.]|uniref:amidohydrolase n=1 Tax=Phenylobacterium sp. TaxID=1871053 RepID=UPI001A3B2F4D|nr:amidohydrolase [Phenylobacterium sp.]MBL8771231.1 amidohydrolase [Phenylobacterium sp.]
MRGSILAAACIAAVAFGGGASAAPSAAKLKAEAAAKVESQAKLGQVIVDTVFSFGELGYQEVETSRYLTDLLEKNGFTVTRGVSGMPTAWTATWTQGSGGPVIAFGSDIDGIPKASQTPGVAYRKPMVEGAPGHGEGHNSGQAVNILAALALKDIMAREKIPGTLMLWPGVAEELVGAKAWFVRDGMFKDVDAAIFTHVSDNLQTSWGRPLGTGLVSVEYTFSGESAHSAMAPWRGKSALDAVELMNLGWNMRREHLRPLQRSHYVISDGGDQPNVVPSKASVWYFFREIDFENISRNFALGNRIADAAAQMTDTTVTRRIVGTAAPRHFNKPIALAMKANIDKVGLPTWTPDEQTFARAVQKLVGGEEKGLATRLEPLSAPADPPVSGGSDDIGDISWTVPTVVLLYPSNIPSLPGHNWANAISMATPIAHKGVVAGGKVAAMTALDLLLDPKLIPAAKAYFETEQPKEGKYVPVIGPGDKPMIERNADIMAQFRDRMRPLYYDASKHPTYLDQLGIRFPELTPPKP